MKSELNIIDQVHKVEQVQLLTKLYFICMYKVLKYMLFRYLKVN